MTRYEDLLPDLSVDEQASLTGGDDDWHAAGLVAHGVPRLKVTDGPVGARGESWFSTTAALFPCGSALGATFDPELVGRVGEAIGDEVRTKAAHVLLGPTLNLHRHPLGGRNFESYGEDPLQVARLGAAFIAGVQRRGVGACAKHFIANDAELERLTISSVVDEGTLREVYLLPFEVAVRDAAVWTVMGAYNRLNGTYACEHEWLLTELLKGEWGFDGLVMSDWHATHHTVRCANAGLDLEMPGPAVHLGSPVAQAVARGEVAADRVTDAARRLLRTLDRVGAAPLEADERAEDDPQRWALAREAAAAATVLLRNEPVDGTPVLPIDPAAVRRVALVGPNAEVAVVQGGGSAQVSPHRTVSPIDGLRSRLGTEVDVVFAQGAVRSRQLPVLDGRLARDGDRPGARIEYQSPGLPAVTTHLDHVGPVWAGRFSRDVDPRNFRARITASLTALHTGVHIVGLTSVGPSVAWLDGEVLIDNRHPKPGRWFFGWGSKEVRTEVPLTAGERHELVIEYERPPEAQLAGLRFGCQPPLGDDPIGAAAHAAATADVAIVVVGTDGDVETEGIDRRSYGLPGDQDELVRRVAAANPRTVVVVNAGAAHDLPWAGDVPALVWSWFGGMAMGEALAAVLTGDAEPAGRLPFTAPTALIDAPCDISRPDPPGELRYTEGRLVGHRWYDTNGMGAAWWFGQGGSYTTFSWGEPFVPAAAAAGQAFSVRVPVANTGARAGSDVVFAWIGRAAPADGEPRWQLAGWTKVMVGPGASVDADVLIDPRVLRRWLPNPGSAPFTRGSGRWVTDPGEVLVRIARHAGDPGRVSAVELR